MSESAGKFERGDALLIIDVQVDFCPGGKLPIPDGDEVVPYVNLWMGRAAAAGIPVILTRDWHPREHPSFLDQGGDWPPHCVQDTGGAAFHPDLKAPEGAILVSKGTRFDRDQLSAFDQTGLEVLLTKLGVKRLWVAGLAQDVCVVLGVEGARELGFEVDVLLPGCRPVTEAGGEEAVARMLLAGARVHRD